MINKLIKSLFGLFIVGFGILNFSYGILNIPDCFHYNVYGSEEYRPCQELGINEDYTLGNSVFHLADFFDFDNLDGYKYIGGNFHTTSYYYMFWSGSELINISSSTWNGRKYIGSPKFCYYSGTDYFGLFQKCGQHGIGTKGLYYDNYLYSFDNIYDIFNGVNVSRYYINNMNYPNAGGSSTSPVSVCGVYDDIGQSFCIPFLDVSDFSYDGGYIEQHYEYINYTDGGSSASDVLGYIDYMTNSPLMFSGGGGEGSSIGPGGIELGSNESAINYYEKNYGWDESICYVGIDNYTDLWGTPVSFEQGSGLSIFQVFSGLYGNTDLNKVYVWLNSWLLNYEQWYGVNGGFGTVGDPHYLATYNSGTNRVDLYYTGFSFPFANNPVAIYFMADYIESKSMYSTMGSSVVSYCNLKINGGSFDDIVDQADKNNINGYTEQFNTNKGLNLDGTEVIHNFPGGSDYGTGDRVILTGNVGSWTGMTWDDMQYSGDVSLKDFFEKAIDEMKSAMDNNIDSPFTGVLPQYIISAFLFVCLFRLLRK